MAVPRVYSKGVFIGYKRGLRNQHENTSLIRIEGVRTRDDTPYYLGKRVVFIYRGVKKDKNGSRVRSISGKITRAHGNSGVVRAKFQTNLPARAMGAAVRVMLYPSNI
eukprot:TRINITY_DN266_c0_g1_i1.p2 TRINITY_DN266_c0_g1~~TRINITY_DN266_c0_g1_i1.p2  ORF type:complete len:126 (+),score=18.97 TRINITY_DN266_c0_g1_i1:56-379(+)